MSFGEVYGWLSSPDGHQFVVVEFRKHNSFVVGATSRLTTVKKRSDGSTFFFPRPGWKNTRWTFTGLKMPLVD